MVERKKDKGKEKGMSRIVNPFPPPDPTCPRYTGKNLPPYRFIPGLNPHPVRDPRGHSYGLAAESLSFIEPAQWQKNQAYLYGVDLYNYGFWWESHEQWENVWHTTDKDSAYGQFLQGLIQISAAFIKWHLRQHDGLEKLYNLGMKRLKFVVERNQVFMGLTLPGHIDKLERHFSQALRADKIWPNPLESYPFIKLRSVVLSHL